MPLPESFMMELKARNDIESVVSSYVNLKRRGRNLVGLCPFHSEKTPSFTLYPENNSFYCFGCGAAGDAITFIRRIENLDYLEAVRFLAGRSGLAMPEDQADDGQAKLKASILEINRTAARFFYHTLYTPSGAAGLQYFHSRGLSDQTIKRFGLGFAPDSWDSLARYLRSKGYSPEEAQMADLLIPRRSGGHYDKFRNRVIFPIIDLRGNVIGFGGRVLDDTKPKYINTSDTMVYKKTMNLFAMNLAKNAKNGFLILAEGYMDVIAMHQAGFGNAVAALGTALTPQQARLMARYVPEVIVAGDADEAGVKAAARDIGILRDAGLKVRLLNLPDGKDPDEFIRRNGPERFQLLVEGAEGDVAYRLQVVKNRFDLTTPEGNVGYLEEAVKVLATIDNALECEIYAGRLAQELSVSRDTLLGQVRDQRRKNSRILKRQQFREIQKQTAGYTDQVNPERSKYPRAARAEETIIAILMQNPDYLSRVQAKLSSDRFLTSFHRRVYEAVCRELEAGVADPAMLLADLGEQFSVEEMSSISGIAARRAALQNTGDSLQELYDCIETILQEYEKNRVKDISSMSPEECAAYIASLKKKGC
ncbi:DNA primase [[Clostridium] leptum]|nr:DNA primase [[Clostridium] leptum]